MYRYHYKATFKFKGKEPTLTASMDEANLRRLICGVMDKIEREYIGASDIRVEVIERLKL